ncbi:MAG TPA: hypothetical protein VK809_05385 [Bacteroidia bacterium]|jgi:hypothetical protein|nr:hypothetical protein [Bacteroidia bacterium]
MKKLSVILAGVVLFGGLSFAAPVLKQDTKAPVAKQTAKPATKATKAPAAKTSTAPAKAIKKVPAKKAAPVKKATK